MLIRTTITYQLLGRAQPLLDLKPLLDNVRRLEESVTRDAAIAHEEGTTQNIIINRVFADRPAGLAKGLFGIYCEIQLTSSCANS